LFSLRLRFYRLDSAVAAVQPHTGMTTAFLWNSVS